MSATVTYQQFTCIQCGSEWQREATRGQPPKRCPSCRNAPTRVIEIEADEPKRVKVTRHREFSTLLAILQAGIHAMLVGPAGSGKSSAARQAAADMGITFSSKSCNPQMSEWDLMGFVGPNGNYVPGVIRDAFENGGLVLLDEMDASNPAVLVAINDIAAVGVGEYVRFPDGAMIPRNEEFRLVAGANTFGDGASEEYVGREQLDAATLDRFACLRWEYDEALEFSAAGDDAADWVTYVQAVRKAAALASAELLVTPRASINGAVLLRSGMPRSTVENLVLWKGITPDARKTIKSFM